MALLLRMAGIPARVSTGFSTGATDIKTGEYVVRDFDAHSWVEVYYPGWGWVTFDPTPAASPARSQPLDASTGGGLGGGVPAQSAINGDPLSERRANTPVASSTPGGSSPRSSPRCWWRWRWSCSTSAGAAAARCPRCRSSSARSAHAPPPAPGTTLQALELGFAATPAAAAYVRTLREERYRDLPVHPSRAQRRALRSATRTGRRNSRSHAGVVGAAAALIPTAPGPTIGEMDDVYDLYQRGMQLLEDGHFHQATVPLAKARDLEPDKTSIREALGRAYFRSGGFEKAREEFEAVVERAPTNDYALFCLGRALMQLGPHRRGPQTTHARGQHEPPTRGLPDLSRPREKSSKAAALRPTPIIRPCVV